MGTLRAWARGQEQEYSGGEERPLGGYLSLMGAYGCGVGATAVLARLLGRRAPQRFATSDLAQLTLATHKISRLLAKDPVTSPLRAPFTRFAGTDAPSELSEQVRGHGLQHAVGELVTCPMCLAQWVATVLCAGLVVAPVPTRLVLAIFTAVAGSDFLQQAYAALQQAAEE